MQNLDVISVNVWSILASLGNLALLFYLAKRFLYRPVKKVMEDRKRVIETGYAAAAEAEKSATEKKERYEAKLAQAQSEADEIVSLAVSDAKKYEKETVEKAKAEASRILKKAEQNAAMELKKAEDSIRKEIVTVSAKLSEKILEREIQKEDHNALVDRFLKELGEDDE